MAKVQALRSWGAHLARLREDAGLSGAEVIARLASLGIGLDRRTIYAYEAGRISGPDAGVVWGLAQIYGVDTDDLISALVLARTGTQPEPLKREPNVGQTVVVTNRERDLVMQLRKMSRNSRQTCQDFIAFESQRASTKRRRED
jgi:transcriptional regulator with XRE-family HTH domain